MKPQGQQDRLQQRCSRACDTCKKRKERCDGRQPCGRCSERGVEDKCRFDTDHGVRRRRARHLGTAKQSAAATALDAEGVVCSPQSANTAWEQQSSVAGLHQSRLVRDKRGRFIFLGDSANLSLLRVVRDVARTCHGESRFVADPLRAGFVEASTDDSGSWMDAAGCEPAPAVSAQEAESLVDMFERATSGLVDSVDTVELRARLAAALHHKSALPAQDRIVPYLVVAIGAQSSPQLGHHAEGFFRRGRYLAARHLTDDASIMTVQAYVLITIYLLSASRRNTASMHLRFAIGSLYALGIHRKAVALRFTKKEALLREKLWTTVRILDLFLSASLGRPVATTETRNTRRQDEYSAWNDLCAILEDVLTQVYERRSITAEVVDKIGQHQREWADGHTRAQATAQPAATAAPDIGTLHMKQMYYWTIMLLTRPFLIERVVAHVHQTPNNNNLGRCALPDLSVSKTLVYACVNSAIKTIRLLEPLARRADVPARLPLLVDAAFHSALTVGLAHFGDLHLVFPLAKHLDLAHSILSAFADDPVASRNAAIVTFLMEVCQLHIERRHAANMDLECEAIGKLFGQIDHPREQTDPGRPEDAGEAGPYDAGFPDTHASPGNLPLDGLPDNQLPNAIGGPASVYAGSGVSQSPPQMIPGLDPFGPVPTALDGSLAGDPQLFWLDFEKDVSSLFTIIGPT
ncbi:Filamentous growth regulator 27 [Metarhizium anisopliae]